MATQKGDCGAVLCAADATRFSGRVGLGLHFAGSTDGVFGFSTVLTQEMIRKACSDLSVIDDKFEDDLAGRGVELHAGVRAPFDNMGSFLPIGVVNTPVRISPKSSLFPTPEFGCLGDYADLPAPLGPVKRGDTWIYPMSNAVKPYQSPLLIYEQPFLEQAVHVAMKRLNVEIADRDKSIYTFEEAVIGVPCEKFRSIPRNTSPGFPYILDTKNGKKEFFGEAEIYDLTSEKALELRSRVAHMEDMARNGQRSAVVFVDFLKDELRSPEKVEAVATRLISSAPLDYTVLWRMYFGAFSAAFMSVHTRSGMAPGINPYKDWSVAAERLQSVGDEVFDGDFKAFDSSEQPCIHNLVLKKINEWYNDGEENARVREVLWADLVHSRHIGGTGFDQKFIYQWTKSLPSGHPFTTIINSIYSLTLLVAAYIRATGDWHGFWHNVFALTYGDDNVVNVSDATSDVYNQESVSVCLKEMFAVTYTPGDKTDVFRRGMRLCDVSFLKRRFRLEDGQWLAPLEIKSFLYTAYWGRNARLMKQIIVDVYETALGELSMHDPRLWDEYAGLIKERLRVYGQETRFPCQRDAYLASLMRRDDAWY